MINLSLKTNPFITKSQREFWVPIERRVQEVYGVPLLVYMENEKKRGQAIQRIAIGLGVEPSGLYALLKRIGPLEKNTKKVKPHKKITLPILEDIDNLEIRTVKSLNCNTWSLPNYQYWKKREQELIDQKKAPSLPAYLLYEHHFKSKSLRNLGLEFNKSHQTIANLMKKLGIPPKYL